MSVRAGDPGLSNERTALAWQRTALSLIVCATILARLTFGELGPVAVVILGLAIVLSMGVFLESRSRYRRAARSRMGSQLRGGRAPIAVSVATFMLCGTEVAVLLSG